jgi:hypothetical protein
VAAYESGARNPNLATLERLIEGCDHQMDVVIRRRTRRGATALADLAPTIAEDLGADEEQNAIRLLFGFADDFRGSPRPGKAALIAAAPPPTGDRRFDAALDNHAQRRTALRTISSEAPCVSGL